MPSTSGVVDAGHGHRLRHAEVGGRKGRRSPATVPSVGSLELRLIVTSPVGALVSTTVKVAVPPRLGRHQPGRRRHRDARGVVVGVGHGDVGGVDRGIDRVAAGDRGRNRVGDVAVDQRVVDAGHRHRLRHAEVGRGKGEARRAPCLRSGRSSSG